MMEKENSQNNMQLSEDGVKRTLYDAMRKDGTLDSLKAQLRGRLYDKLNVKGEKEGYIKAFGGSGTAANNKLSFKLAASMVADLMKKCDMPYAMSVFLPEAGLSHEVLNK